MGGLPQLKRLAYSFLQKEKKGVIIDYIKLQVIIDKQ